MTIERIIVTLHDDDTYSLVYFPPSASLKRVVEEAQNNITAADKTIRAIGVDNIKKIVITPKVINIVTK